ncbi:hypothetical protein AM588_10000864 [Phytophthora nicotianae]|uniref:NPP1 protein n=1 Tax=Phytophthora nicotianae TaxID=4792 RepID=A0A0W8CMJ6_PHYNI|nr:hypothetical protein AM588_10000864 [Phytophthora nicotianae]
MNLGVLFLGALLSFVSVNAGIRTINHDQVQPFEEMEPTTDSEKSAIKYKPQLHISKGCYPYPAVQANGAISGGLKWSGWANSDCEKPVQGSQIYSRSDWYKGKWAIMYAWYFPKGAFRASKYNRGHRHFWSSAIVWTDNTNPDNSAILGVSMSGSKGYVKKPSPKTKYIEKGTTLKLDSYIGFWLSNQALRLTKKSGGTQDLVTWEQLTDEARDALSKFDFDADTSDAIFFSSGATVVMPLEDGVFTSILEESYPFK